MHYLFGKLICHFINTLDSALNPFQLLVHSNCDGDYPFPNLIMSLSVNVAGVSLPRSLMKSGSKLKGKTRTVLLCCGMMNLVLVLWTDQVPSLNSFLSF